MRIGVLVASMLVWAVVGSVAIVRAQREVPLSTRLYVIGEMNERDRAIAQIRQDVALISKTAADTAAKVRDMELAVWGCAGTVLLNLFMQVIEIRKRKREQ